MEKMMKNEEDRWKIAVRSMEHRVEHLPSAGLQVILQGRATQQYAAAAPHLAQGLRGRRGLRSQPMALVADQ